MNIYINELYFNENELLNGQIALYVENEPIVVPCFLIDSKSNAITKLQSQEIESVKPTIKNLSSHIYRCIDTFIEKNEENVYVYLCYRNDIVNSVGMAANNKPMYKLT